MPKTVPGLTKKTDCGVLRKTHGGGQLAHIICQEYGSIFTEVVEGRILLRGGGGISP